jgi:DNA-binding NarL/FixJ family response regulator
MENFAPDDGADRKLLRVLLVEDDETDARIVFLFAGMSEKYRFDLTHVRDMDKAWHAIATEDFDLCLLDYWVGHQTSLRLLSSLDGGARRIATVVLSNISSREVENMRIGAGAAFFLSKGDCSAKNLENAVQTALRSAGGGLAVSSPVMGAASAQT